MEIIVLGAYGHVGKVVTKGLMQMDFIDTIIAVGRNKTKFENSFMENRNNFKTPRSTIYSF